MTIVFWTNIKTSLECMSRKIAENYLFDLQSIQKLFALNCESEQFDCVLNYGKKFDRNRL